MNMNKIRVQAELLLNSLSAAKVDVATSHEAATSKIVSPTAEQRKIARASNAKAIRARDRIARQMTLIPLESLTLAERERVNTALRGVFTA